MAFNAQKKADKWARRMADSGQDYKDGIDAVDVNPGQLAADHANDAKANYAAVMNDGSWARKVASTPVQDWKNAAKNLGAPRLVDGVTKGKPKVNRYLAAAGPMYDQIRATVRAMPKSTPAERRARRDKAEQMMAQLKGAGRP